MLTPEKKHRNKKLKRSDITDEMRRKFHVCEHDKVGYSEISKLALFMLKRSKQDAKDIKGITEVLTWQKQHIEELKKINEVMVDKYEDALEVKEKELQECHKDKNDITRAYNGLAQTGRYAESLGINIEKASKALPENKNKYNFKQKHSLLESGKVSHEYFFGKKKNGKADK